MVNHGNKDGFFNLHPFPDKEGHLSLYRYYKVESSLDRLRPIFLEEKLYHSLPESFNDPFDCRPKTIWPTDAKEMQKIRLHLIKTIRQNGPSRKEAEKTVGELMSKPAAFKSTIEKNTKNVFSKARVCCFSTSKSNLLLWAHYADSHKGMCIEFDASQLPMSMAYKINYSTVYPKVTYPITPQALALTPLLQKSLEWKYENEYRSILLPFAQNQHTINDGESVNISSNSIKQVIFGARMDNDKKLEILEIIRMSKFNPEVWQAEIAESEFKLKFVKFKPV